MRNSSPTSIVFALALTLVALPAAAQGRPDRHSRGDSGARVSRSDGPRAQPRDGRASGMRVESRQGGGRRYEVGGLGSVPQRPRGDVAQAPAARGGYRASVPNGQSAYRPSNGGRSSGAYRGTPSAQGSYGGRGGAEYRSSGRYAVPRPPAYRGPSHGGGYYRPGYGGHYRPGHGGYYRPAYGGYYGWRGGGYYGGYYPGYYRRPYYAFRPWFGIGFGIYAGYPVGFPAGFSIGVGGIFGYPAYGYGGSVAVVPGPTQYGGLSFEIDPPNTNIVVDGTYVGDAGSFSATAQPLTVVPGRHRVELRAPGFQPVAFDVDVLPGQVIPYQGALVPLQAY